MSIPARQSTASEGTARRAVSAEAAEMARFESFTVAVQRREHITIVQPRGELDIATVETLRTTFDAAIADTLRAAPDGTESSPRLVLDLRGLSFIDSSGLHLLRAVDQRAKRDGFQLTLVAPTAPVERAIQLCGLDQVLTFVAPDALEREPAKSASGAQGGG